MTSYVDRLIAEIRAKSQKVQEWSAELSLDVDSVYFGGGTPSLLPVQQMREIVKVLHEVFCLSPKTEMTLECAPGQLSDALLNALPEIGFNRVSLGVQSFIDKETAAVGRLHKRSVTLEEISRLRRAGIQDINVDLIAGLPHQTTDSWQESVQEAIFTGVLHLSVYMLDVDEDSRLGRELLEGGTRYHAGHVPDEQAIATMYDLACEQFTTAGIPQYEISNFARPGQESRHNLKYWTRQPYLGFGLDAHSFLPTHGGSAVRIASTDDLTSYLNQSAPETITPISNVEAVEEAWFLGLRLSAGVSLPEMEGNIGHAAMHAFQPVLHECQQEGLLERTANHVRLTQRGRLFANEVFARFIGVQSRTENEMEEGVLI